MHCLNLTLADPDQNLLLDESLLDWVELTQATSILRFWQPSEPFVVLGYGNKAENEVHLDHCSTNGIPTLRRCSGGGTVLMLPGCLNFALILPITSSPLLESITETNHFVMRRQLAAIQSLLDVEVKIQGTTDLAIHHKKISGNAQRRRRKTVLFHGSFLVNADLNLIQNCLKFPSRSPDYRKGRPHDGFLANIGISEKSIKRTLCQVWGVTDYCHNHLMDLQDIAPHFPFPAHPPAEFSTTCDNSYDFQLVP